MTVNINQVFGYWVGLAQGYALVLGIMLLVVGGFEYYIRKIDKTLNKD